jgi:hypothetical protein
MTAITVTTEQVDIDQGDRSNFGTHPLLVALCRAFGVSVRALTEDEE